jgi:hypothetical protein
MELVQTGITLGGHDFTRFQVLQAGFLDLTAVMKEFRKRQTKEK